MSIHWKRYALAGGALAAEVAGYLLWRPRMLRWGATREEASESLPGDDYTPHPRVQSTRAVTIDTAPELVWPWLMQMGIGRAGFYTHDWVERLMFRARYVDGRHSATRIHPELALLQAGDSVPLGGGVLAPVLEVQPGRHLVAQEIYVLRPLPGNRTRLIARYRGMGFISPAARAIRPDAGPVPRLIRFAVLRVPGADLALRALDFFVADPLHHYMETGMLTGIKARAEGKYHDADDTGAAAPPWSPWRPRPDGTPPARVVRPRPAVVTAIKAVHTLAWLSIESSVVYVLYTGLAGRTSKRAGIAGAIVAGETLVFAANGFRCPLTGLAERYGAEHGSVTDIYLPKWFAHNLPAIHAPLLVLMACLHARNLRQGLKPLNGQGGIAGRRPAARPGTQQPVVRAGDDLAPAAAHHVRAVRKPGAHGRGA
ncbi:MAG TPA: hypothetical protein VF838_00230 [Trebonia sp.]